MPPSSLYLIAQEDQLDVDIVKQMLQVNNPDKTFVHHVESISSAFQALSKKKYDALILDLSLSSQHGLREIQRFISTHPTLPIVIIAGTDNHALALKCLQLGVQDYIYKNQLNAELLRRIMRYAVERKRINLELEQALVEADKRNRQLTRLARTDTLTKLPNRAYFFEATKKAIATAKRLNRSLGVLYFDLNNFKIINDRFGHSSGDHVLIEIATRLKEQLRNSDMVARIGGDEFVVLTNLLDEPVQAYSLAQKIHNIICKPIIVNGNVHRVGASIGIATYPEVQCVEKLVQSADMAMYEAKENNQHFACFYTKHLENKYRNQRTLESELDAAFSTNELSALYQPIISKDNSTLSVESLCRWHSEKLGTVSPDKFIPIAESTNLGDKLGNLMLAKSADLKDFCSEQGIELNKLSINVFGQQFTDKGFANRLLAQMEALGIPPDILCIEITERQMIENLDDCQSQLKKLKAKGVQVALDDFGTGFSSVTHLKSLPIDILKLDRSLTSFIDKKDDNHALCDGIIHMAHRLDMKVIAEGIERQEEYDSLAQMGCDEFQGYLFGRPMKEAEIVDHWRTQQKKQPYSQLSLLENK